MRKRTEEKRNAILTAAREVFRKKGYQNTSMSEITEKVGGSKATIYGYFKSKKLLFEAVMNGASLEIKSKQKDLTSSSPISIVPIENYRQVMQIMEVLECSRCDVRKTLYQFGRRFMQTICQPEFLDVYRLAVESSTRTEIGSRFYEEGQHHVLRRIQRFLQKRMDLGELRQADAKMGAYYLFGLIRSSIFEPHVFCYGKPMSRAVIAKRTQLAVDAFMMIYEIKNEF